MTGALALVLSAVDKSFGSTQVLRGVDLEVPVGSLTAVLGPSGCGKTTLLRLVAGFADPDAGTISIGGRTVVSAGSDVSPRRRGVDSVPGRHRGVDSVPARRRGVGYVPQEGALFPHLSVADNIMFGLPKADRRGPRLVTLLDLVGLPAVAAERYPHELSGGQQQRAALARALAPQPAVVLLDEPFSALDAGLREETGRAVAGVLRASGATAVLVTHDQGQALSLADRVAVLRDGVLVQVDHPDVLYRRPADPGVAAFVGGAVLLPARVSGLVATCVLGDVALVEAAPEGESLLLVRPEQLVLGAVGAPAQVLEVSYFGHDASVRLRLRPDGPEVLARVSGLTLPRVGDQVHVCVRGPAPVFPLPQQEVPA